MKSLVFLFLPGLVWAQVGQVAARVKALRADPAVLKAPGWVTVSWSAAGVETVLLDPIHESFPAEGQVTSFVNGRTVFWVHAYNDRGGESRPVVIDLAAGPKAPAQPERPPALPLEPAPAPAPVQVQVPAPAPAPVPAPVPAEAARRPVAKPARAGEVWIQFAAMVDPANAERLQKKLRSAAGVEAASDPADLPGGTHVLRVRLGPFPDRNAARIRLRALKPKVAPLGIKPIVCAGP